MRRLLSAVIIAVFSVSMLAACGGGGGGDKKKCGEWHDRAFKKDAPFMGVGLIFEKDKKGFVEMCANKDGWKMWGEISKECWDKKDSEVGDCVDAIQEKIMKKNMK